MVLRYFYAFNTYLHACTYTHYTNLYTHIHTFTYAHVYIYIYLFTQMIRILQSIDIAYLLKRKRKLKNAKDDVSFQSLN